MTMPVATIKPVMRSIMSMALLVFCSVYLCLPDAITCNKSTKLGCRRNRLYNPSIMLQYYSVLLDAACLGIFLIYIF